MINNDEKYPHLPILSKEQSIYDAAYSRTVYAENMSIISLKSYCMRLEEQGYSRESFREQSGNVFYTYTSAEHMVYVYYTKHDSSIRAVCTPIANYKSILSLDTSVGNGDVTLTQLDIGYKHDDGSPFFCGMSYAIRLSNGSFILIDGGNNTQGNAEADNLYGWLKSQTYGGDVVISAWIITHLHFDHTFTFIDFVERYGDKVEIKALIHNYPAFEYWKRMENTDLCEPWHSKCYERYERAVSKYIEPSKVVVPHNGQILTVGDARIEILHTNEDLYPKPLEVFNDSSNVFRIEIKGQSIMFSGDAQETTTLDCVAMYGEHLKSDFLQVSHHGSRRNAALEWYKSVGADILMYPIGLTSVRTNEKGSPTNIYLLIESKYKEVFFGGHGAVEFTLPYQYSSYVRFSTYGQ